MLFGPDDLTAQFKSGLLQTGSDFSGMQPCVPHVGDIARKQRIRTTPIDSRIIGHLAGLPLSS